MQKINSTIQPKTEILSLSSTITGKKTTDDKDQIHSHTQPIIAKRKITKIQKLEKKIYAVVWIISTWCCRCRCCCYFYVILCDWIQFQFCFFALFCFWMTKRLYGKRWNERSTGSDGLIQCCIFLSFSSHSCMSLYVIKNDDE